VPCSPAPEGTCDYLDADLRRPQVILREAGRTLDFSQPAAVMLVAVLHFLADADDPQGIVASLAGALAPGSFVAISHLTGDFAPDAVTAGVAAYNALVPAGITARSHAQVTALFGGLPLVAPGVVPVLEWRPGHAPVHGVSADMYAGLATTRRKARWPSRTPATTRSSSPHRTAPSRATAWPALGRAGPLRSS